MERLFVFRRGKRQRARASEKKAESHSCERESTGIQAEPAGGRSSGNEDNAWSEEQPASRSMTCETGHLIANVFGYKHRVSGRKRLGWVG